ncbi:MAG: hypothetical protein II718_08100, partial [Clostridiales bacterium]|nr:hypothetical protein [Clostridiales bacterium]
MALLPIILIILPPILVVVMMLEGFQSLHNAISGAVSWLSDKGKSVFEALWTNDFDEPDYEKEAMDKWNLEGYGGRPEDRNYTSAVYQEMKKGSDERTAGTEEEKAALEAWEQFNSEDHAMISSKDVKKLVKHCYEQNNSMFEKADIQYEFKRWSLNPVEDGGVQIGLRWEIDDPVTTRTDTTTDGVFGKVTRSKTEGEKAQTNYSESNIDRIFSSKWQDYVALAGLISFEKGRNLGDKLADGYDGNYRWGETGSDYDNGNGGAGAGGDDKAAHVNSTSNYFLIEKDFQNIKNLLDYKVSYEGKGIRGQSNLGWDAVAYGKSHKGSVFEVDIEDHPSHETTLKHDGDIGYRYWYEADPENHCEIMDTETVINTLSQEERESHP